MILNRSLDSFGNYCTFMWRSIGIPEKWRVFFRRYMDEIAKLGIDSIPLILIVSLFIGSLCTILIKLNINNPLLPRYTVGLTTREIILLEFSSSILCLRLTALILRRSPSAARETALSICLILPRRLHRSRGLKQKKSLRGRRRTRSGSTESADGRCCEQPMEEAYLLHINKIVLKSKR